MLNAGAVGLLAELRSQNSSLPEDPVIEMETSIFDQTKNCGGGNGLGNARDPKEI